MQQGMLCHSGASSVAVLSYYFGSRCSKIPRLVSGSCFISLSNKSFGSHATFSKKG